MTSEPRRLDDQGSSPLARAPSTRSAVGTRTTPGHTVSGMLAAVVAALDAVDDHVVVLDDDGLVLHVNTAWQRFALDNGWENTRWVGMDYVAMSAGSGAEGPGSGGAEARAVTAGLRDVLGGRRPRFTYEYDCHAPDDLRWFRLTATAIDAPGIGAVVTHADVTQGRLSDRALERAATTDPTTGLPNRASVQQWVAQLLHASRAFGLVVVSITGHEERTASVAPVMKTAAALLSELFPAPTVVGRYAGTRLVVVVGNVDAAQLQETGDIVRDALAPLAGRSADVSIRTSTHRATEDLAAAAVLDGLVGIGRDAG